jgi:hypothetical protein
LIELFADDSKLVRGLKRAKARVEMGGMSKRCLGMFGHVRCYRKPSRASHSCRVMRKWLLLMDRLCLLL